MDKPEDKYHPFDGSEGFVIVTQMNTKLRKSGLVMFSNITPIFEGQKLEEENLKVERFDFNEVNGDVEFLDAVIAKFRQSIEKLIAGELNILGFNKLTGIDIYDEFGISKSGGSWPQWDRADFEKIINIVSGYLKRQNGYFH